MQSGEEEQDGKKNGGEFDDEEAKYGATDRRNKVEVANQDGGVFKSAKNNAAPVATKKKKVNKYVTAPEGKFRCFHKTI